MCAGPTRVASALAFALTIELKNNRTQLRDQQDDDPIAREVCLTAWS
jgi:hypothetical protein